MQSQINFLNVNYKQQLNAWNYIDSWQYFTLTLLRSSLKVKRPQVKDHGHLDENGSF